MTSIDELRDRRPWLQSASGTITRLQLQQNRGKEGQRGRPVGRDPNRWFATGLPAEPAFLVAKLPLSPQSTDIEALESLGKSQGVIW